MTKRETSAEIDADAALWAARVDAGPLDAEQERALESWLDGDVRRQGAFAKARAVALHADRAKALGSDFRPEEFVEKAQPSPSRRRMLMVGGATAAIAASVAIGIGIAWRQDGNRYRTQLGQVRVVSLEDGSVVTLNTASELVVNFTETARAVQLVAGEALFDVAHDAHRPFIVDAGEALVRAIGTSFTVRRLVEAPVEVLVREGVVEVSRREAAAATTRITANERAVARPTVAIQTVAVPEPQVDREIAWRDGRIAFEGETLRQAAAEFSRYSDTRIVFDDPSIADETVTGLFVSTDPVGFSRAVGTAFDLNVQVREGEVRLSRD